MATLRHGLGIVLSLCGLLCGAASAPGWTLVQNGTSGISGLELAIVSPTLAIFLDKLENNPLQIDGHPAWGALFNLETNTASPLSLTTNSFCAGGTFISNGTLVSIGGDARNNPAEFPDQTMVNGLQAIRLFGPCTEPTGAGCTIFEDPKNIRMVSARWYPTVLRIFDGSAMIFGGSGMNNFYNMNNTGANIEFFPSKDGNVPRPSPFMVRTLPANLMPLAVALPDGKVFMAAANLTQIYDIETNTETPLPELPNNVRVTYPFTGTLVMLPLSPPAYTPEVLICGGSSISDATPAINMSSLTPATTQCTRMVLTPEGIAKGWQVEHMLEPRVMPELVLLPTGDIVLVNGAMTGVAAYAAVSDSPGPGSGNADNPAFTPSLYTPSAPNGQRFTNKQMPTSNIPRLYHSTATLTPNGNVMIAGNNPNMDVNTTILKFPTEFKVEFLNPPFMAVARPSLTKMPEKIGFGQRINVPVNVPRNLLGGKVQVALMDLGFSTHGTKAAQRLVFLVASVSRDGRTLTIEGPPNGRIFPPGPGFIFLSINGVASKGAKVMIGTGANPPIAGI